MTDPRSIILSQINDFMERYPWYAQYLKPSEETLSFNDFPLMTEEILLNHYYHANLNEKHELAVYRTSGTSSGIRKQVFYSKDDDERYLQTKVRVFRQFLDGTDCHRVLSDMGTGHAANTAAYVFRSMSLDCQSISFELPVEEHILSLQAYKPDVLYTMPSILDSIISHSDDVTRYGIKKIILVGEIAPLRWQSNIARLFCLEESDILDTYGSIEVGLIAAYDHRIKRYVIVEGMFAETVSLEHLGFEQSSVESSSEGVLVVSCPERAFLPGIRYVMYDVVRNFSEQVVDGQTRYTFESIVKRVGNEIKHGEKISIYDIENVVYHWVKHALIRVKVDANELYIFIKSEELTPALEKKIHEEIQSCIPEIGKMIENRLLKNIQVVSVPKNEELLSGSKKNKKLYHSHP